MSAKLTTADIGHIIDLIEQITKAVQKTDFLIPKEKKLLDDYRDYEHLTNSIVTDESLAQQKHKKPDDELIKEHLKLDKEKLKRIKTPYNKDKKRVLENKLSRAKMKYLDSYIVPLQEELDLYLAPRLVALYKLSYQYKSLHEWIGKLLNKKIMSLENNIIYDNKAAMVFEHVEINCIKDNIIKELKRIKAKIEYREKHTAEIEQSDSPGFMSVTDLAKHHDVNVEALRKRLDRYREKHALDTDFFVESQNRGRNKPRYLYSYKKTHPIIEKMKKKTSVKCPTKKI